MLMHIFERDKGRKGRLSMQTSPTYYRDAKSLGEQAMADVISGGWLAPGGVVVWEESQPPAPVPGTTRIDQRKYGDTLVTLLRADHA